MNHRVHIRFDFSECLMEPHMLQYPLGSFYIDCYVPPYKVPQLGEEIWLDDDDPCQVIDGIKSTTIHLKDLYGRDGTLPPFTVKKRCINFTSLIPYDILIVLKR